MYIIIILTYISYFVYPCIIAKSFIEKSVVLRNHVQSIIS